MKMSKIPDTPRESSAHIGIGGAETDHGKPDHARITGGLWDRGKLLQKDTGRPCPIELKHGETATWSQIADWISNEEGATIPRQTIQRAFNTTLKRLGEKLLKDPFIRTFLMDNGYEIPEDGKENHEHTDI
tara:strand:+ start:64 stop:456 length:393 start_codon:yes stop_codon:yes gene_type:complete